MKALVGFFRAILIAAVTLALIGTAVALVTIYKNRELYSEEAVDIVNTSVTVLGESDVLAKGSGDADAIATGITPIGGTAVAVADAERIDLSGSVVSDATISYDYDGIDENAIAETPGEAARQEDSTAATAETPAPVADETSEPAQKAAVSPIACTDICFVSTAILMLFIRSVNNKSKMLRSAGISQCSLSKGAMLKLKKSLFTKRDGMKNNESELRFSDMSFISLKKPIFAAG